MSNVDKTAKANEPENDDKNLSGNSGGAGFGPAPGTFIPDFNLPLGAVGGPA